MSHLAPYAVPVDCPPRRVHPEPADAFRSQFESDVHRIVESTAFRRLERKTQVFAIAHHDHFRTRLTHTLEVALLARTLAKALHVNDSLAESITLAHDLGHPPFGHAGEVALNQAMADHGGFNHNLHTLRVVDFLEHPFPAFRGLNLTAETRSGIVTHATLFDEPADPDSSQPVTGETDPAGAIHDDPSNAATSTPRENDRDLPMRPSVEAQVASLADRIAYDCHDLEDAIGAGFITAQKLAGVEIWQRALQGVSDTAKTGNLFAVRRAVLNTMVDDLLADIVAVSLPKLEKLRTLEQVRSTQAPLLGFGYEIETQLCSLEQCLHENVYRNPSVCEMDAEGGGVVTAIFAALVAEPSQLPQRFADRVDQQGVYRVVCDYVAGMTDTFAQKEYERVRSGS